jgi:hypothetical protein
MSKQLHDDFDNETDLASSFAGESNLDSSKQKVTARLDKLLAKLGDKVVSGGEAGLEGLKDFSLGAVDAATMGFGDEIGGGLMGAYESLANDKDFQEEYKKYKESIEKTQEESKERSPWLHGAGELGGGAASLLATGGLGLGAKAAVGASKVGQVAKALGTGAAMGGIYGAGESKGSVMEDPSLLASDVAEGAITGGLLGGTADIAGQALKPLGKYAGKVLNNYIEDSPILRQKLVLPIKTGFEQIPVTSQKWFEDVGKPLANKSTNEMFDNIQKSRQIIGSHMGKVLDEAKDVPIDVQSIMGDNSAKFMNFIDSSVDLEENTAVKKIAKRMAAGDTMSPKEASMMADELEKYGNKLKGVNLTKAEADMGKFSNELAGKIKKEIGSKVEGYDDLRNAYYEFNKYIPETILKGDLPAGATDTMLKDLSDPNTTLNKSIKKLYQEGANLTKGDNPELFAMKNVTKNLGDLQTNLKMQQAEGSKLPDFLSHWGKPEELEKGIRKSGDFQSMMDTLLHTDPHQGGATTGMSGVLGQLASAAGAKTTGTLVHGGSLARTLYNIPDVRLRSMATKLQNSPLKHIGDNFIRAIDNKNNSLKNAAIFAALQQPEFRQYLLKEENGE